MHPNAHSRLEAIRRALDNEVRDLSIGEYIDVLEELDADIAGRLEAAREEAKEE